MFGLGTHGREDGAPADRRPDESLHIRRPRRQVTRHSSNNNPGRAVSPHRDPQQVRDGGPVCPSVFQPHVLMLVVAGVLVVSRIPPTRVAQMSCAGSGLHELSARQSRHVPLQALHEGLQLANGIPLLHA